MQGAWVQSLVRELDPTWLQLRVRMPQLKILCATTKIWYSQIKYGVGEKANRCRGQVRISQCQNTRTCGCKDRS